MATKLVLLGFVRTAATEYMHQVKAAVLSAVNGKTCAGVVTPAESWPSGLPGLQLQNDILCQLHNLDAVLPVRAGTVFNSVDDLQKLITRYDSEICNRLGLVTGKVELGLELWTNRGPQPDPECGPGRQYLKWLGGSRLETGAIGPLCTELHSRLGQISADSVRLASLRPRTVFRASYLVPRENVDKFAALVAGTLKVRSDIQYLLTGPWPPYSFSCLELAKPLPADPVSKI